MALSDAKLRKLKGSVKPDGTETTKTYKVFDEKGLYVEVTPKGARRWRFKYRIHDKEKLLSLGTYPEISLKEAREKRDEFRKLVAQGVDPSQERKAQKRIDAGEDTFQVVAEKWVSKQDWSEGTRKKNLGRFENHVFPFIGSLSIGEITVLEFEEVTERLETLGTVATAHRIRAMCENVFNFARAKLGTDNNPAAVIRGTLKKYRVVNHPSISSPKRIGELMRDIQKYEGRWITTYALRLSPYLFLRPIEIRSAEWAHFDLERAEWRIPAEKMKMLNPHIVPLSRQALAILHDAHKITGHGRWLFPSQNNRRNSADGSCMSDGTVRKALYSMGYQGEMTAHGFRSTASTMLHEKGYNSDWIERQLAHVEGNSTKKAYDHSQHLDARRQMMQDWADLLDELKEQSLL